MPQRSEGILILQDAGHVFTTKLQFDDDVGSYIMNGDEAVQTVHHLRSKLKQSFGINSDAAIFYSDDGRILSESDTLRTLFPSDLAYLCSNALHGRLIRQLNQQIADLKVRNGALAELLSSVGSSMDEPPYNGPGPFSTGTSNYEHTVTFILDEEQFLIEKLSCQYISVQDL